MSFTGSGFLPSSTTSMIVVHHGMSSSMPQTVLASPAAEGVPAGQMVAHRPMPLSMIAHPVANGTVTEGQFPAVSGIPVGHWGNPAMMMSHAGRAVSDPVQMAVTMAQPVPQVVQPVPHIAPPVTQVGRALPQVAQPVQRLAQSIPVQIPAPMPHMQQTGQVQHIQQPAISYVMDPYYCNGMMAAGAKPPAASPSMLAPQATAGAAPAATLSRVPIPQENTTLDEVKATLPLSCRGGHCHVHCLADWQSALYGISAKANAVLAHCYRTRYTSMPSSTQQFCVGASSERKLSRRIRSFKLVARICTNQGIIMQLGGLGDQVGDS